MKRILIAGAAGFLGSHLCEHFLSLGHDLICVDRHNDMPFIRDGRASLCLHDVTRPLPMFKVMIDYVLHFASRASPKDFMSAPLDTLHSNSDGTQNLLDLAMEKSAVFLFPSSSQVYSDLDPSAPRSVYAEAKRYAEALVMANRYSKTKIVRMFNVYGPGMRLDDGRVIPAFITKALKGEDITIMGGKQLVSFTYVSDMVEALTKFLFVPRETMAEFGNPERISILELARGIIKLTGSKSKITTTDDTFPNERLPNLKVAKGLGWRVTTSLEEGLTKTIEDFRRRMV